MERVVDPLGLVLKAGAWYLVAAVEGAPRVYRVSSIHRLEPTEDAARTPPDFDLAAFWAGWAKDFEARLHAGTATLRLTGEGLRRLRIASPLAAVGLADPPEGEMLDAVVPIESVEAATDWLARIGPDAEALDPPALRQALAERGRALSDLYGDSRDPAC